MGNKQRLNQCQYAKRIGVSRAYISKLVKKGTIELRGGLINPDRADRAIEESRHPSYAHLRRSHLPSDNARSENEMSEMMSGAFKKSRALFESVKKRLFQIIGKP